MSKQICKTFPETTRRTIPADQSKAALERQVVDLQMRVDELEGRLEEILEKPARDMGFTGHLSRQQRRLFGVLFQIWQRNKQSFASRSSIYIALFGYDGRQSDKQIDVVLCQLRKRIVDEWEIETVWAQGYRLVKKEAADIVPTASEVAHEAVTDLGA